MNSKTYLFIAALVLMCSAHYQSMAQDEADALRYSFISPQGTARSIGFGSALGSVGGDFTSLSVNPAGIGIYRKSEFMFTPSVRFNTTGGNYLGQMNHDNATRFNFSNIGIIFTKAERGKRYERSGWKAISFGIGINRMADFNRNYSYSGLMKGNGNNYSSFSEIFVADANQNPGNVDIEGTLANMGYNSYLINQDSLGYYTLADWTTGLYQRKSVTERGGISEIVLSLGGNYQEKIMIGATLGLPSVRYSRESFFEEADATDDPNNFFSGLRYSETLKTTGLGVNLKLGIIYKPSDFFRLGVALHTPTWFALSDVYNNDLTANTETFKTTLTPLPGDINPITTVVAPENRFDYNITTPWRAIVSATALMGKYGFFTADYEYVDYSSIRYNFDNEFSNEESLRNKVIKSMYQGASNFRIGVEGRMDNFFIRGGLGYYGSPYKQSSSNTNRLDFSAGIGIRTDRFFTDIAFVHSQYDQYEVPYTLPDPVTTPTATLQNRLNNIALTIGWKL